MEVKIVEGKPNVQDDKLRVMQLVYDNITFINDERTICKTNEDIYKVVIFDNNGENIANIQCMSTLLSDSLSDIVGLSYVYCNSIHSIIVVNWEKFILTNGMILGINEQEESILIHWMEKDFGGYYLHILDRKSYDIIFDRALSESPITALASRAVLQFIVKDAFGLYGIDKRGRLLKNIDMMWQRVDKNDNIINDGEEY